MIPEREDATLVSPKKCVTNGICSLPEEGTLKTFRPQVEVHLKKGIAKSQLEEKLPELETLIKQQRNIRNWIPAELVEVEMADRSKSLADLIQGIVVGCMNYPDAYPLDDILDKVRPALVKQLSAEVWLNICRFV
ncbi:unnamed protein product [Strongylus vulgaris]|uniref:Pch2-like N-terminal domain-containing protein n=1 Tax=Strongylus vulgaris TaxID=40348 RepID=A0A3P7JXN5_STRVU|nr:unnamed protein product [Strongylus vulgaris]